MLTGQFLSSKYHFLSFWILETNCARNSFKIKSKWKFFEAVYSFLLFFFTMIFSDFENIKMHIANNFVAFKKFSFFLQFLNIYFVRSSLSFSRNFLWQLIFFVKTHILLLAGMVGMQYSFFFDILWLKIKALKLLW